MNEKNWSKRGRGWKRGSGQGACLFLQSLVGAALGIGVGAIRTPGRGTATEALARQTAMYLAHVSLGFNLSQVGASFGRDRTTVAHACVCIEKRRDDPIFEFIVACLEAACERWRACLEGGVE
jgi:hypothetical protein